MSTGFLPHLAARLAARTPFVYSSPKRASVCIILRVFEPLRPTAFPTRATDFLRSPIASLSSVHNTEIFFIKRATNEGDAWSGNVAYPGGRQEPEETDQQTAERECLEEVGLDLNDPTSFMCIGRLDDRPVYARGRRQAGFAVCPFVFVQTCQETPPLKLDKEEVAAARWVPVSHLTQSNIDPMGISMPFSVLPALRAVPKPLLSFIGLDTAHYPSISLPYRPFAAMHEATSADAAAGMDETAEDSSEQSDNTGNAMSGGAGASESSGSSMRRRFAAASAVLGRDVLAEMATSSHKAVGSAGQALHSHHHHQYQQQHGGVGASTTSTSIGSEASSDGLHAGSERRKAASDAAAGHSRSNSQLHAMGMEGGDGVHTAASATPSTSLSSAANSLSHNASSSSNDSVSSTGSVERFDSPSFQFVLWGLTLQATSDLLTVAGLQRLNWPPIRFKGAPWNALVYAVCGALEVAEVGKGKRRWTDVVPKHLAALLAALMVLMAVPFGVLALLWRQLGAPAAAVVESTPLSVPAEAGGFKQAAASNAPLQ